MFSDELRQKYLCFKKGRSDFEAECITVDMEHLFLWQTKAVGLLALMTILRPQTTKVC